METTSMACRFSIHMKIVENSINDLINEKYKVQIWINTKKKPKLKNKFRNKNP